MWLLVIATLLILFYLLQNAWTLQQHWKKRGVKYVTPLPFIGNMWPIVMQTTSMPEVLQKWYNQFSNDRYFGIFNFTRPILMVRDPELIRRITIQNFDHFVDHEVFVSSDVDPLWNKNLFQSTGNRWRNLRQTMSPAFTGSKMRIMHRFMDECALKFIDYFSKEGGEVIEVEMKEIFSKYTNDVIASAAFGIQINSLEHPNNDFLVYGKDLTDITGWKKLKFLSFSIYPRLVKFLGLKIVSDKVGKFFTDIIEEAISLRESNKVNRPDLIQLLVQARQGKLKEDDEEMETSFAEAKQSTFGKSEVKQFLSNEDIVAQAIIFFFGGYDTISYFLSFMAQTLVEHPDIQNKLRAEIVQVLKENNDQLTYNAVTQMKYLDMVVSETLRLWPQAIFLERKCTKDFIIEPELEHEVPITIKKGENCWFPVFGIQRDPEFYPDPNKFDPERFSEENKSKIVPYTFLPFGTGPRNCIGNRFALLESKTLFVHLIKNFEIIRTAKTQIPLKISRSNFNIAAADGFHMGFKRIH